MSIHTMQFMLDHGVDIVGALDINPHVVGKDIGEIVIRVCPNCGHTVIGDAPDKCPVCSLKGENYEIISTHSMD